MLARVRTSKAFTLIELIIVLVILAILAALAIPTYQAVVTQAKVNTTTQSVKALDREAQALAAEASDSTNVKNYVHNGVGFTNTAGTYADADSTVLTVTLGATSGQFKVYNGNTGYYACLTPSATAGGNNPTISTPTTSAPSC